MGTSANMWLSDSHGNQVRGESSIIDREGSINLLSIDHSIHAPFDPQTGQKTSPRAHAPFSITKPIDATTPHFNKACCSGEQLKEVVIDLYRINPHGSEEKYFRYSFEDVKVTYVSPMIHCSLGETDSETVSFIYNKIRWEYLDGNIAHEDSWNKR